MHQRRQVDGLGPEFLAPGEKLIIPFAAFPLGAGIDFSGARYDLRGNLVETLIGAVVLVEDGDEIAIDAEALVEPVRRVVPHEEGSDTLNRLLRADARLSLADDLLTVADRMSMAHSVELRVPFLDLEYFGLIERMPSRYKVSAIGSRKWLYRRAVAGLLPAAVRHSLAGPAARLGRKVGFSTPIDRWFTEWLERDAGAYLTGPEAHLPDHLDPAAIANVVASARAGAPRSRQLSALYVLESWLRGSGAAGATAA